MSEEKEEQRLPKMSAEEALAMIGLTVDEVDDADAALAEQRKVNASINRHVCACGHAIARHTVTHGIVMCKPARMECPCKKARPVLLAQDTRLFIRKTEGGGAAHALSRGIRESITKGKAVEWLIELVCDRCGTSASNVTPVPVSQQGTSRTYATGYDALLCPDCRVEV